MENYFVSACLYIDNYERKKKDVLICHNKLIKRSELLLQAF